MKTIRLRLLSLFLLSSALNYVQAQKPDYNAYTRKRFFSEIEFYGGPAVGSLRGNPGVDNSSNRTRIFKIGYTYGIGATHNISNRFYFNVKVMFERKGGASEIIINYFDQVTQTMQKGKGEEENKYYYYTLPVSIHYSFDKQKRFKAGLGLYVSYLNKQTFKQTSFFNGSSVTNQNLTKYDTKLDFGCVLEVAYQIPITSKLSINASIINTLGFVNTLLNPYEGQSMKTNNTSILLGVILKR